MCTFPTSRHTNSMPNWCFNQITLKGHPITLDEIMGTLSFPVDPADPAESNSLLSSYVPMPKVLNSSATSVPYLPSQIRAASPDDAHQYRLANRRYHARRARAVKLTGSPDWYTWALENWSTKWPDQILNIKRTPRTVKIQTLTAWSPPLEALVSLSHTHHLQITCDWDEPGCAGTGRIRAAYGELTQDSAYHPRTRF